MGLKYKAHPPAITLAIENFNKLNSYLSVRDRYARKIINSLKDVPGLVPPQISKDIQPSWYALVFQYRSEAFGNLPIEIFFKAVQAEGLFEADLPGSTSPLNLLPLFQNPSELFPAYSQKNFSYKPGDFPRAEQFYRNAIKLPVWAEKRDSRIVDGYIKGIKKVADNYKSLL